MPSVRIKICCIADEAEAHLAVAMGADALGLVSAMPSGPGMIDELIIARVAAMTPPGVASFLLTCRQRADEIILQQRRTGVNTLQLCDRLELEEYAAIREALPGIKIVQVVHVTGPESVDEARACGPLVDALLLDSGNPNLAVKELGGTGRVHDWRISREIVETAGKPVWLAGGLTPETVGEAWRRVQPFGLDICSGVRTEGRLDRAKLTRYTQAVRALEAEGERAA